MKIKIFSVDTTSERAVEDTINEWLEGKEFSHLQIAHISDHTPPRIGTKVYVIYEESLQPALDDEE